MAIALPFEREPANPLDKVERLAERQRWDFDRSNPHEVTMLVDGGWSDMHVAMTWRDDVETLLVACTFETKVPPKRRDEMARLVALINTQLLHGHFELWPKEGNLLFRDTLLLAGGAEANEAQCETLIRLAIRSCERYFPAVQFVLWAGRGAEEALEASLFETVGEA